VRDAVALGDALGDGVGVLVLLPGNDVLVGVAVAVGVKRGVFVGVGVGLSTCNGAAKVAIGVEREGGAEIARMEIFLAVTGE